MSLQVFGNLRNGRSVGALHEDQPVGVLKGRTITNLKDIEWIRGITKSLVGQMTSLINTVKTTSVKLSQEDLVSEDETLVFAKTREAVAKTRENLKLLFAQTSEHQIPEHLFESMPSVDRVFSLEKPVHIPESLFSKLSVRDFSLENKDYWRTVEKEGLELKKRYPDLDRTELSLIFIESLASDRTKCGLVATVWSKIFNKVEAVWTHEIKVTAQTLLTLLIQDSCKGLLPTYMHVFAFVEALSVSTWLSRQDLAHLFENSLAQFVNNDPEKLEKLKHLYEALVEEPKFLSKENLPLLIFEQHLAWILDPSLKSKPTFVVADQDKIPDDSSATAGSAELFDYEKGETGFLRGFPDDLFSDSLEGPYEVERSRDDDEKLLAKLKLHRIENQESALISISREMPHVRNIEIWTKFLTVVSQCKFQSVKQGAWHIWISREAIIKAQAKAKAVCWNKAATCVEASEFSEIKKFYLGKRFVKILTSISPYENDFKGFYGSILRRLNEGGNIGTSVLKRHLELIVDGPTNQFPSYPQLKEAVSLKDLLLLVQQGFNSKNCDDQELALQILVRYLSDSEDQKIVLRAQKMFFEFLKQNKQSFDAFESEFKVAKGSTTMETYGPQTEAMTKFLDLNEGLQKVHGEVCRAATKFLALKTTDTFECASLLSSVASAKVVGSVIGKVSECLRAVEGRSLTEKKEKTANGVEVLLKLVVVCSKEELQGYTHSKEFKAFHDWLKKDETALSKLYRTILLRKIELDCEMSDVVVYLKDVWSYLEKDPKSAKEVCEAVVAAFIKDVGKIPRASNGVDFKTKEDIQSYIKIGLLLAEVFNQGAFFEMKKGKKTLVERPLLNSFLSSLLEETMPRVGGTEIYLFNRFIFAALLCQFSTQNDVYAEYCNTFGFTQKLILNIFQCLEITSKDEKRICSLRCDTNFIRSVVLLWQHKESKAVFEKFPEYRDHIGALLSFVMEYYVQRFAENFAKLKKPYSNESAVERCKSGDKKFSAAEKLLQSIWDSNYISFEVKIKAWRDLFYANLEELSRFRSLTNLESNDFNTYLNKFADHFAALFRMVDGKVAFNSLQATIKLNAGEHVELEQVYAPLKVYEEAIIVLLKKFNKDPSLIDFAVIPFLRMVDLACKHSIRSVETKKALYKKMIDVALKATPSSGINWSYMCETAIYTQVEGLSNFYQWVNSEGLTCQAQSTKNGDSKNPPFDVSPSELYRNGMEFLIKTLIEEGSFHALQIAVKVLKSSELSHLRANFSCFSEILLSIVYKSSVFEPSKVLGSDLFKEVYNLIFDPNLEWRNIVESSSQKHASDVLVNRELIGVKSLLDEAELRHLMRVIVRTFSKAFQAACKKDLDVKEVERHLLDYINFLRDSGVLGVGSLDDYSEAIEGLMKILTELNETSPHLITQKLLDRYQLLFTLSAKEIPTFSETSLKSYKSSFALLYSLTTEFMKKNLSSLEVEDVESFFSFNIAFICTQRAIGNVEPMSDIHLLWDDKDPRNIEFIANYADSTSTLMNFLNELNGSSPRLISPEILEKCRWLFRITPEEFQLLSDQSAEHYRSASTLFFNLTIEFIKRNLSSLKVEGLESFFNFNIAFICAQRAGGSLGSVPDIELLEYYADSTSTLMDFLNELNGSSPRLISPEILEKCRWLFRITPEEFQLLSDQSAERYRSASTFFLNLIKARNSEAISN